MGASCGGDVDESEFHQTFKDVGLQAQHAYSVLDVKAVEGHRYDFVILHANSLAVSKTKCI